MSKCQFSFIIILLRMVVIGKDEKTYRGIT